MFVWFPEILSHSLFVKFSHKNRRVEEIPMAPILIVLLGFVAFGTVSSFGLSLTQQSTLIAARRRFRLQRKFVGWSILPNKLRHFSSRGSFYEIYWWRYSPHSRIFFMKLRNVAPFATRELKKVMPWTKLFFKNISNSFPFKSSGFQHNFFLACSVCSICQMQGCEDDRSFTRWSITQIISFKSGRIKNELLSTGFDCKTHGFSWSTWSRSPRLNLGCSGQTHFRIACHTFQLRHKNRNQSFNHDLFSFYHEAAASWEIHSVAFWYLSTYKYAINTILRMLLPSYSTGKVCKDEPSASPCVEVKAMNFTRLIATFSIHSGSRGIISSPTRVNSCCMLSGGHSSFDHGCRCQSAQKKCNVGLVCLALQKVHLLNCRQ